MDQKEFDAILKSHKHAEESPGDIADRIISMGQPKRTIGGTLKDIGVTTANAAIGAGEAVVGLADLATGGMAGKGLSQLGYDPKAARNFLQQYKSEAQQAADRRVDEAKGFGGTLKAYLRNPSTIVEAGAESLPSMFLGGGIGRGIGAAGKAAGILSNPAARAGLLGAIGEGVVGAGSAAEQIRQETGELTGKGAASAIGSGVGTGVLGRLGNKLAPKLGAVDIEEALVRGFSGNARNVPLSFGKTLKAITGGAISEGAFEELPQSIQEQVWQNYATGKPLMEGVPEGAAQGLVTGAAMGGAVNIHSALPGQQRKALAELEQKRQAELAQEHDKLVREATRGQVALQAATGQNLPGVSSAGLNFDGGSGLPPGVAPYMAGQNASTFDLMREQQQRQAQTALDLEQRQQAAREQVLQQERIQNQLAANGFGYASGQRAAVHGAPDEMASALAGETEEEYQQRLGNLEHRRQQGQQGLINVLQNHVDMQRQNAQATAGAIAKAAQAAKQQENEQAQRDRFDQWAAAERAAGRDVGPFSMDEQQQAKATSSGPLGKAAAKGFGALNEAERAVEYGRIFDRGATNTQAIEQIQAERERAFLGDGESSDAGLPEFRQELAANRRERVAQGLPATLTPDAKAAATIEGVDFRQQPGSKLPPELDYQVSRMEAQLQESITGTHEANVDQNGDTVWLKGKGYWPQWMEKKTMPRGKWAKQGTQERKDQAEALKNANILHDAGRDKILAVIDKARKGVALGSHEKSIWSAIERIASQPGGPALWGQSDMLIADANEAAANERMQARYGLSMLPKPMTVRVADIEPGETLAVDGMVEDVAGKTVLYTHKGIDAQGNTIMERGEHDAVTGKTGAARVMRFEPTDHLEGVIGVRERADREQSPNRTTKAYNREGKAFRSIEKQGIAITEPQNIPVDMLRPGDRVVIRDPQGMPDVATMRGYDSNNRAVIRDGIEYHLQADDNITVEGFRAKGEVRQTKGFGYRPKNERQQIAREYEQDRQERAERSEILREAKTQVRGELTNTLRQIAGKRRIHAEEQRALATQANKRQQAGADSKQGTPQAVMPKGSRPTVSLGYGFHPGDNTPTLERARAQKQEQKENRKTFPGTQYETGEQRVRENRRNFPATKYETGKPGRIEREAFARPTGYQQVKPAASALRENKRQSGLARQQEGEARPQGIIRGGTDNDRALAHEQYQAVLDFAAGKLRRENAGLSTREARRQAIQQLGLEEKAVPETGWWRERAGKSPGYLANLLSKSAAKRTKTAEAIHVEHSSGSNPYFLSTEKSTIVPLKDLLSSEPKLDAARVDRARANMDAAAAGTGAKRKPLPVYRRSDGKLVALDGNSTLAVLRERGEKSAIVEIKKTIKQPRATLDEIYADAAKADVVLRKSLADFVERTGGRLVSRPDGQIKSRERAEQKARQDNTPRKLKDIVAHTLVYPDQKTLMQALPQFEKEYGPIELKNRFENPPDSGYRDILANVRVKEADGHIAEIQLTTEAMLQAKEGLGHKIYEVQRELDDIAKRTNNAEATELALEFDKISKEYYEAAAQSSNSSKSASASSSALFRLTLSPDLNKTLARASELLVSMNSSPNIRKSVLDLESSLKGVPSQSKYRSSMESSPVAEEKSSGSGENIQQKAAQSEENQAPAGKTEARETAAQGKPEVPVILPPGSFRNEKVEITKRGRKWLKGKRVGKNYEIKIEINDVSRDWQAGQTVEFPAHVEVEQSKYGITTTSYPLTAEQVAQARVQAVLPDIKRWLGYVEEKAHEGHVYQNGVQKLRELGIASLPEYQKRLDAALASVKERKEAEATREASEGRTWLRVPYADKDHAKKHGARFDGDRKQWYVIGKDVPEALEQYLPDDSRGGRPNDKRPGNGQPEQKEAGQYTISNGSGYGGSPYKTGETIRSNRKDLPEYVTVIRASQRYYGEDGMSFGVGDDSGYVYTATVREATREEAAPVRAREEAKKARKQAKEMLLSIAREIRENGDRPELQGAPAGVRIDMPGNPENIHGGGEWFVIGQDRVWHVRNNGADGDDWSANNIRTGGAGAIGFAIPFDRGLAGRLVGALEAAGADIPQAARKLTEGESGPRESRAEERQTKALPESERANIEGELITAIGKLQTRRLFGSMGQVKILDTQDDAQRVIASGHIVKTEVRHSKGGAIQGITMPDGQVYLVRDGIAKGQAMPVLLHELGEHAAQLGFKDMQYRAILRSMERQAKDDSETGRAIRKGIARARAAGVRPDNKYYWSEVAAYTIEENADVHTSLLDRIVNYFKGLFLKVCGVQAGKFSHKDLVMFAKAAVKAATRRGAQFGKYDPQKSLWSADESQTGLRSISETGAQREYDEVVKRYKGTAQWLKAPNGKPSNLNERQWVQVRTPSFKKWFGDWESLATARAIRDLVPVDAANVQEISSKKDIENYFRNNSAVTNTRNGVTVSFPIATAGKIYHHKGLPVGRIVGRLKEIFEHSIPFLSEKEELKEGHKAHPNIDSFDHYVGKVSLGEGAGGGEYYVRFTVRKEVVGKKGNTPRQETHNVAVSDVQIYEKPDAANLTGNTPGEGSQPAFVDSKLRDFFAKVKSEEVSKVLDANGEPLVVYHAVGSYYRETGRDGFTVFDRSLANVGFMFSDNKAFAEVWGTGDGALAGGYKEVFLNIKNPFELDAEGAPWSSIPNPMLQDGWDLEDILEEARQDKPLGDNMRDGGNKITVDGASYYFEKYRKPIEDEESGLIVRNVNEALSSNIDVVTDYIAFSPSQIKSATDNTGDFDSENPDIRYSFAGEKGAAESREDITNQAKDYGRRIREAAAKWASVVDQAIKDIQRNKKPSKPLEVGPTPDLLVQLGIPDLRVVMGLSVVNKIMFKKHGLTAEQTKALYEEMSDPVAVVRYGEEDYAVVTGMKKGDSPIIVGLNVGDGHQIHVNTITSAYGKDGFKGYMIGKAQDGQIVYLDKKKLAGLVERTIPGGDISQTQFLGGFQQDLQRAIRGKIKYPSDVVKPQFEESAPTTLNQIVPEAATAGRPTHVSAPAGKKAAQDVDTHLTAFQQVREQINRILPNKDEAKAIIAIIEARAFSAGLTPEEFVTKRGLTFVDAELPVNPQGKLLEKMMGGQLRGAFNVRDYVEEGRAIITAFRGNANVSTLAHELGHLFRQDLKRYGQDRLLAMAEHWAGVKNGRWNREQEEKFARGFEAYLLEGKAPTTAMGKVFERFRVWISRLYGALVGSQLNVGLDDEIRSVFDALLTEHAAEDAGDAFAEGIAKTRARIAELEGSGPIDLDHRTLFQIGLADSGGAGNTFTGWTSAINRIMSSHPKWRDRWERFIYNMVDTNDPRERIWKAAGSPDAQDIVTVERLRGKKAAAEQKTFRDGMVTPLLKSMAAAGLKASDLEEYAHAMHAPERNQRMREVNAKRVLESLLRQMPAKDADEYRELINLAQSGLRQGWDTTDVQRFYLDQMQKIFNDLSAREQQCNELARTATSNAAQQRVAKMQEQIAESYRIRDKWRTESQRFAGITDGEAQSIVAKWRQDKRFAAIEDARQQLSAISRATLDTLHEAGELGDEEYQALRNGYQYYVPLHRDGFQDTRPATGRVTGPTGRPFKVAKGSMLEVVNILPEVIRAHETAINRKHKLEAGRALYEFALAHPDAGITVEKQEQMPTHDREGNIVMYTRQTEPEDGVFVKVDGKRYLLRFEADVRTPEGRTLARFLDSIKGQDALLGGITKSLHKITRLLAAVNTSLSPEFVVSNFSRDLQTALMHLNQEDINMKGLQSQVLKSVGKAVRGIWLAERGKPGNNEMARWYRDFEKNGGKVGWVQNYDGIEDLSKKLAGEMKLYEPGNRTRKITRAVLDFIDAGNVAIENALRLATYKAMVEKGIDRAKAAGIASNLTVDFTRKGKLSPQINALYMFFNASVQGSYRMAKALATSPRVRKIAGGIAASGFLLQMLALAGGGDDDSDEPYVLGLPDSTRERYILIPMPGQDGRFFKFPKAYGYGALYDLGAEVANSMYMGMTGRQYNHAKGAMRVVSSFANSFNPIQSATILQTIAPTLVDPFVYVGENTNWTGLPLRPAQNNFGPKKPESGRAWKNTNPIYKSIAEGVNSLTGGDRYESGLVDISPEVFEMAVNTALGGLGRFIGNTAALPLATAKGELDAEKIPFVRQVYTKWDDRALSNRYYEAMERAQIARMRFKNAETLAEKRSIFDSPEYKIWRQSNATDKQVKRLRARLNRMEAAGNTVGADYLRKQIVGLQSKVLSTIM